MIAILSTIALFGFAKAQGQARDVGRTKIMNGYQTALERYFGDTGAYPAAANFGAMHALLIASNYITAPTDPKSSCVAAIPAAGDWVPCAGFAFPVYSYAVGNIGGTNQSYTLTLTKESGGTLTFVSPQ